jgi:transcription initiation factor TFIID subunit 12
MQTGDTMSGEKIAQMLIANMGQLGELAKQGKLTHQQITQVRVCHSACCTGRY